MSVVSIASLMPSRAARRSLAVAAIAALATSHLAMAATKEEVAIYVRDHVLVPPAFVDKGLWMTESALSGGPGGHVARNHNPDVPDILFPFAKTWLVMVDDQPTGNWGHTNRWVFVEEDAVTGELVGPPIVVDGQVWFPTVFADDGFGLEQPFDCYANPVLGLSCEPIGEVASDNKFDGGVAADDPCLYAVLVSGGWTNGKNYARYSQNLKSMFNRLRAAGYPYNQIWVYYADGTKKLDLDNADGDNDNATGSDVDGAASEANIRAKIKDYSTNLDAAKNILLVYFTNHGDRDLGGACNSGGDGVSLWDFNGDGNTDANEVYTPAEIADDTKNPKVKRLFMIADQCYSGLLTPIATDGNHANTAVYAAATDDCESFGRDYMASWEAFPIATTTLNKMHPASLPANPKGNCPCTGGTGLTTMAESKAGVGNTYLNRCGDKFPMNDLCTDKILIGDLVPTLFTTVGATTDPPDHPGDCAFSGQSKWHSDIWFEYVASCSGRLTVSTCATLDAGFDTRIAVYLGSECPTDGSMLLACNDDAPGCGKLSELTLCVDEMSTYLIRVAGYDNEVGSGLLTLTCRPFGNCPCIWDINGDGFVDGADLGGFLSSWGDSQPSIADFNEDNQVDGADLAEMLAHWGPCSV